MFDINRHMFVCREKRQKIEDIKKNIRDAIIVSISAALFKKKKREPWNFCFFQTITGAMSTLSPPVSLEHNSNQGSVDYIQDVASQHDFDYPQVSFSFFIFGIVGRRIARTQTNNKTICFNQSGRWPRGSLLNWASCSFGRWDHFNDHKKSTFCIKLWKVSLKKLDENYVFPSNVPPGGLFQNLFSTKKEYYRWLIGSMVVFLVKWASLFCFEWKGCLMKRGEIDFLVWKHLFWPSNQAARANQFHK